MTGIETEEEDEEEEEDAATLAANLLGIGADFADAAKQKEYAAGDLDFKY